MNTTQPKIGVTLDFQNSPTYSKFPWYALRENYVTPLTKAGALVFALPFSQEMAKDYVKNLDGVVISGGDFDVPPHFFGEDKIHQKTALKENRSLFEMVLIQEALQVDMPILGICGGMQVLNVAFGGTLIQHIPDTIDMPLAHEQPNPRNEAGHVISVCEGTHLRRIVGTSEVPVNSAHHQAVKKVGEGGVVSATASDGVIEAIEFPAYTFCLGVQYHPEFFISPADEKLLHAFVKAASVYAGNKTNESLKGA